MAAHDTSDTMLLIKKHDSLLQAGRYLQTKKMFIGY